MSTILQMSLPSSAIVLVDDYTKDESTYYGLTFSVGLKGEQMRLSCNREVHQRAVDLLLKRADFVLNLTFRTFQNRTSFTVESMTVDGKSK